VKSVTEEVVRVAPTLRPMHESILTREALAFVSELQAKFAGDRRAILGAREQRQRLIDSGLLPDFINDNADIKASEWQVSEIPKDLLDRRVEITGPAGDRKMVINALNSGASTYMADFEDSQSPTWRETLEGQVNLRDAVDGSISFESPDGKQYQLNDDAATLIVRPRGWHLVEKHATINGVPISASLFDFGLFLFHNAESLVARGSGPYFYLPKMEDRLEARLWEQVCVASEDYLDLPRGTIKVTALIETLPAVFQMDEILYELRRRIVGLNCGRWDYMFSYIKTFRNQERFVLPDRAELSMDKGFLAAYVDLLIETCHRRGAYAIGGMSAYIPVRGDEDSNRVALERVRADKEREVKLGHDGTWVAHPGLVNLAMDVFKAHMKGLSQLGTVGEERRVTRDDLLRVPSGKVTEKGVRTNVSVGLQYLSSWLSGRGCVPINYMMEDAATAEISRAQLWQWIRHGARMDDGRTVTADMVKAMIAVERNELLANSGGSGPKANLLRASTIFERLATGGDFQDFLTLEAYDELVAQEGAAK
jgi:malate synthase